MDACFTPDQIKAAGYSSAEMQAAGIQTNNPDCDLATLKKARANGVPAAKLRQKGCSLVAALKAAGFSAHDLATAGFNASQLKDAGFNAKVLRDAGFSAGGLKAAGFSSEELLTWVILKVIYCERVIRLSKAVILHPSQRGQRSYSPPSARAYLPIIRLPVCLGVK